MSNKRNIKRSWRKKGDPWKKAAVGVYSQEKAGEILRLFLYPSEGADE